MTKYSRETQDPRVNPPTSSYNVSVVKIYNANSSLLRFEINKNIFFYFEKRCNLL
jgi:hypothetical protein